MGIPTVKTLTRRGYSREIAAQVRREMEKYADDPIEGLYTIDLIIGGYGVESIAPGRNTRSPEIYYVNMGDSYAETVMAIDGKFRLGDWGSIVERGNYD